MLDIQPGQFDQRVTLQSKSVTRAANGEEVVSWASGDTFFADVKQLRGREFFDGAQVQDAVDVRVRCRYRTDVAREKRLMWGSTPLDIVSVIRLGRNQWLEIMCLSGVRNG